MNLVQRFLAKERKSIRLRVFARRTRPVTMEGNEKSISKGMFAFLPSLVGLLPGLRHLGAILAVTGLIIFMAWMGWCVWQYEVAKFQRDKSARKIFIRQRNALLSKEYWEDPDG
jgi:hypothetical protein